LHDYITVLPDTSRGERTRMEQLFVPTLVAFTSTVACLAGAKVWGLSCKRLLEAVGKMLEGVGLTAILFVFNVAVGAIAILGARSLLSDSVSLYLAADITLLPLSLLQALAIQWWHQLSKVPAS